MQLQSGTLLQGGKYKIETVLGQGGFGITYLATQVALERKVAIKEFFMKEHCNRDVATSHVSVGSQGSQELVARFRQKFVKEARMIAGLNHPHIIRIIDVFEENGTAYYVMEYMGNGSLAEYLKRNGAVRESEALHYIYQLADALKFIHQHQMNHLDIKPGNVLLDNNNNATLRDFGLSKRYDGEGHQTSTTPIGISAGYAPMEQYKQGGVSTFSPATDIYSLGATLYKLLTNETPPDASDVNDDGLPPLPPSISQSTADTIEKAMQPRRRDRPQSIDEFLSLLTNNNKPSMQYNEEESETTIIPSISPKAEEEPGSPNIPPKRANHLSNREIWFIAILILLVTSIFVINKTSYNVPAQNSDTAVAIENPIPNLPAQPIDLGLSVKWASWNVGASSPEDYGGLYGWADPTGNNTSTNNTDYPNNNPPSNICGTNYDIAHIKWGENWRLPTKNEVLELCEKCSWKWTSYKGSNGYMITGPSGNYIFLPAVGQRYGTNIGSQKNFGYYWSGTLYSTGYSNYLSFSNTQYQLSFTLRYLGCSVRPVSK